MGTFNDGLKYSNKFTASVADTSTSGNLYTVPANSYAIINYALQASAASTTATITVDSVVAATHSQGSTPDPTRYYSSGVIYAGAGAVIGYSKANVNTARVHITGIVISNIK